MKNEVALTLRGKENNYNHKGGNCKDKEEHKRFPREKKELLMRRTHNPSKFLIWFDYKRGIHNSRKNLSYNYLPLHLFLAIIVGKRNISL